MQQHSQSLSIAVAANASTQMSQVLDKDRASKTIRLIVYYHYDWLVRSLINSNDDTRFEQNFVEALKGGAL